MIKITWIFLTVAAAVAIAANSEPVRKCRKRVTIDDDSIHVSGCDPTKQCVITRGTTRFFKVKFTPDKNVETLETRTFVRTKDTNWTRVPPFDACDFIHSASDDEFVSCPLKRKVAYFFERETPYSRKQAPGDYEIHWALVNQDDHEVACFEDDFTLV